MTLRTKLAAGVAIVTVSLIAITATCLWAVIDAAHRTDETVEEYEELWFVGQVEVHLTRAEGMLRAHPSQVDQAMDELTAACTILHSFAGLQDQHEADGREHHVREKEGALAVLATIEPILQAARQPSSGRTVTHEPERGCGAPIFLPHGPR